MRFENSGRPLSLEVTTTASNARPFARQEKQRGLGDKTPPEEGSSLPVKIREKKIILVVILMAFILLSDGAEGPDMDYVTFSLRWER